MWPVCGALVQCIAVGSHAGRGVQPASSGENGPDRCAVEVFVDFGDEAVSDPNHEAHVGADTHPVGSGQREEMLFDRVVIGDDTADIVVGDGDVELIQQFDHCRQFCYAAGSADVLAEPKAWRTQGCDTCSVAGLASTGQFVQQLVRVHGRRR